MPDMRLRETLQSIRFTREEAKLTGSSRWWGPICELHPELEGERYTSQKGRLGCVGCHQGRKNVRLARKRRTPGTLAHEKQKARRRASNRRKERIPGHPRRLKNRARIRAQNYRKRHTPGPRREKEKARVHARQQRKRSVKGSHHHLRDLLSGRLRYALNGASKSAHTLELLGCTIEHLRRHLEAQFTEGMEWAGCGSIWHIDHIRPCASFDLTDLAQQRVCFHWTNLQPMLGPENEKKGAWWSGRLWANGKPVSE